MALTRSGQRKLLPVGKAYFGFTDSELRRLEKWVRNDSAEEDDRLATFETLIVD